jgi:hypothetical protein
MDEIIFRKKQEEFVKAKAREIVEGEYQKALKEIEIASKYLVQILNAIGTTDEINISSEDRWCCDVIKEYAEKFLPSFEFDFTGIGHLWFYGCSDKITCYWRLKKNANEIGKRIKDRER